MVSLGCLLPVYTAMFARRNSVNNTQNDQNTQNDALVIVSVNLVTVKLQVKHILPRSNSEYLYNIGR